jgi:hypothetical protein
MKNTLLILFFTLLPVWCLGADITWEDKATGGTFTAADANEAKTAVNSKADSTELDIVDGRLQTVEGNVDQDVTTTGDPVFSSVHASGGLSSGTQSTTKGSIILYSDANPYTFGILPADTPTGGVSLKFPPAAAGGSNYLLNFDADGTGGWTDPDTLGGDDLGDATATDVSALYSGTGEYLKKDGSTDTPTFVAFDPDQFNETGDGLTEETPKVITIEPSILGSGSGGYVATPTYSNEPCGVGDWSFDTSYTYICEATDQWDRYAVTFDSWSNPGDFTAPLLDLSYNSTGTEVALNADDDGVGDCSKLIAECDGAPSTPVTYTGTGPCAGSRTVYGPEECTATAEEGLWTNLNNIPSEAFTGAIDNSLNTAVDPDTALTQADDFERADGDNMGANWTQITGSSDTMQIFSGRASAGGASFKGQYWSADAFSEDQESCAVVTAAVADASHNFGVYAKAQNASQTFYQALVGFDLKIGKVVSGTSTNLVTGLTKPVNGESLCIQAESGLGDEVTVSVTIDGVPVATHTDATGIQGGQPGIGGYNIASPIESWSARNL